MHRQFVSRLSSPVVKISDNFGLNFLNFRKFFLDFLDFMDMTLKENCINYGESFEDCMLKLCWMFTFMGLYLYL